MTETLPELKPGDSRLEVREISDGGSRYKLTVKGCTLEREFFGNTVRSIRKEVEHSAGGVPYDYTDIRQLFTQALKPYVDHANETKWFQQPIQIGPLRLEAILDTTNKESSSITYLISLYTGFLYGTFSRSWTYTFPKDDNTIHFETFEEKMYETLRALFDEFDVVNQKADRLLDNLSRCLSHESILDSTFVGGFDVQPMDESTHRFFMREFIGYVWNDDKKKDKEKS